MNTQHFKYALEVEKTGSITQAAENLFMGQPNLSKSIKELEDNLGIVIFKRTSRGVVPTVKGRTFLKYAKKILNQIDEMQTVCQNDVPDLQSFNVCVPRGSYVSYAAMNFIASLDVLKPIDVNLGETTSIDGVNMVSDGIFNIGVIRYQTQYENYFCDFLREKGLCSETIWEFESLAVMSENHPLSKRETLTLSDFAPYIEITHGDCSVPYINVAQSENVSLSLSDKKVINLYEGTNQYTMLSMVSGAFMWCSPTPKEILDRYHLVQKACDVPAHKYKDVLIYREGGRLGYLDRRFLDKLYEVKNRISFGEAL
ncbi:MAG: LysR family transcriptional regulator [Clostridia bacterium]|nr:LysR family transcriptional regulator [Clostridia bacterium]